MKRTAVILGIDVGSVSVAVTGLDSDQTPVFQKSIYHHGEVKTALTRLLEEQDLTRIQWVAKTASTPSFVRADTVIDEQVAIIRAARHLYPAHLSALLYIGGEKFFLSHFDDAGAYTGARQNTSCAAGTGSFLDQQAGRLGLSGSKEISRLALENTGKRPDIATRCAVFAKTDLIHAQQEGYTIEQICDGLCFGLAKNIANTLFKNTVIEGQVVFCGGVAKNQAVQNHLEAITKKTLTIDDYAMGYGSMGAALCACEAQNTDQTNAPAQMGRYTEPGGFFAPQKAQQGYRYPELALNLSTYPDFTAFHSYQDTTRSHTGVEVDIYEDPASLELAHGFLGLDVGSTSTKSILINQDGTPVAGFYTKTASRPVAAVQNLFAALDKFLMDHDLDIPVKGCGTTGSGRRISAKIIGADIEPDEITAHARAAVNLNPDVDTIIEIGGQDAKFTLLKDQVVTSSVMNTVCAAGTGSFIEEQATRLDCPLSEYSSRTEGVTAPVSSDRCTVFMERDINYFFAEGYEKNEILASVLHSVRDNYLTKVANVARIGSQILFQGATARNKALVAAFEQKLGKPIHVSRFCHLTGALGVALMAHEQHEKGLLAQSKFRGFKLWKEEIPIRQEVCQLCTNHCKITIAQIDGKSQAYGFLCQRDYDTKSKSKDKTAYDLLALRREILKVPQSPGQKGPVVGLPDALHMTEEMAFWEAFFKELGIKTRTSRNLKDPVSRGKAFAGAEFCAPVTALHGHVDFLMEKTDFVFLPFYFEDKTGDKAVRRQHCYYTQFTPALVLNQWDKKRILTPTIKYLYTSFHTRMELYTTLKAIGSFSFFDVSQAYDRANQVFQDKQKALKSAFTDLRSAPPAPDSGMDKTQGIDRTIKVLLVGRPYTILSKAMNNNIPDIFSNLGIQTVFQDMLDYTGHDFTPIAPLLKEIHWKHAADILKAAHLAAADKDIYPVYISSFKCAPDSFAVDYFKEIMEKHNKPYLVLELDEHDSSTGYETRIEAAVRAFSNHHVHKEVPAPLPGPVVMAPNYTASLKDKTIVFPNWDNMTGHFIVNILKNQGYHAVFMEETEQTLKQSLLTNTGQCLPLNAVASAFIHTVEKNKLDPARTLLWLNRSEIACNIKMYPYHIQKILQRHGKGFDQAQLYLGDLSLFDISFATSKNTYFAYMFGGFFRSVGCKIRPYEINKGQTDQVLEQARSIMGTAFLTGGSLEKALKEIMDAFGRIPVEKDRNRPKVGIFGDLYVRDNAIMNQDLIRFIEQNGGEVVTTPYYTYVQIIADAYFKKWFKEGKYLSLLSHKALLAAMKTMEKKYYAYFKPFLNQIDFEVKHAYEDILKEYGILGEHTGESMDNLLKIHHIVSEHPDLALLVQTNPAFCCPGMVTEAMGQAIENKVKVPIVSITYDLSGGNKNQVVVPFLKYLGQKPYFQSRKVSV